MEAVLHAHGQVDDLVHVVTRTTGSTGIICSVQARLWSRGTSATSRRGVGSDWTRVLAG